MNDGAPALPHDLDLERVLLGQALERGRVGAGVEPGDFFRHVHAVTWRRVLDAQQRGLSPELPIIQRLLTEHGELLALKERMAEICGDHACRHSVRSGRRLTGDEMNALLRQMEATPHSGQCNHGRPTYVELKLKDIERLFGRR